MIKLLDTRHELYNETRRYLFELEKDGKAVVIAPEKPLEIGRFEKKREPLDKVFRQGIQDARNKWPAICAYLEISG